MVTVEVLSDIVRAEPDEPPHLDVRDSPLLDQTLDHALGDLQSLGKLIAG